MSHKQYEFLNLKRADEPYLDELQQAVNNVITGGRYIGGPAVKEFEETLARQTGVKHAVGVSNGLDALRLILRAYIEMGILRQGDEVIVPANTYIASILAVTDNNLTAVLVEPNATTSNLDSARIEHAITQRTRAIMPVHLYGRACWNDQLREIASSHNLLVIEDNAQAIGAQASVPGLNGTIPTGSLGHAAGFSFYPTKNIGAIGDAGAITTNDPQLAATVRALANYGSDVRYHNIYQGYNCRLDPIQAAILSVRMRHIEHETAMRRGKAIIYNQSINNPHIVLPPDGARECVWHQYVIHTPHRESLLKHLDRHSVGWDIHYATPPHLQPCYNTHTPEGTLSPSLRIDNGVDITLRLASQCVSLPIAGSTSPAEVREIAEIINLFRP